MRSVAAFDWSILKETDHRPWPVPASPWMMTQSWHDLLFAHWPVPASEIRRLVPAAFEIDLFDTQAWVSVVPFRMTNIRLRLLPPIPGHAAFPEINVRTYVRVGDRPGIYFFSFDAARRLAVQAARTFLNLPYFAARMRVEARQDDVAYESARRNHRAALFRGDYAPVDAPFTAARGSLEYFLAERYCLYNLDHRGRSYRLDIHHRPWPLQVAQARLNMNTMAAATGIALPRAPSLLHFAKRLDVIFWAPAVTSMT